MKPSLPVLLSINGGYVDAAGFLALQGLFTSHVTGNFVTLGAALVLGSSGVVAKLLALPMFCAVVFATRLLSVGLTARGRPVLRTLLLLQLLLLIVGAALAVWLGPFHNGDGWQALVTGLTLVAAMAVQNAVHRIHLGTTPPNTIMTGNTTQLMIDLADLARRPAAAARAPIRARALRLTGSIAAFAAGCAGAALLYDHVGIWCFTVPPLVGFGMLSLREGAPVAIA
ncbi:MAG TPA: DUF1275 family protein [Steroidobacteraceae bacterium]